MDTDRLFVSPFLVLEQNVLGKFVVVHVSVVGSMTLIKIEKFAFNF